ncbi:MAG: hypothetical protein QM811_25425 [Pirellulales bacterium]
MLYARVGQGFCPKCDKPITAQSREQIIERILQFPENMKLLLLAPVAKQQKGEHRDLFVDLIKQGFNRARVDGNVVVIGEDLKLDRNLRHSIEVVIDRITITPTVRGRLAEGVEQGLKIGGGTIIVATEDGSQAPPIALEDEPTDEDLAERSFDADAAAPKAAKKGRVKARTSTKAQRQSNPGDVVFSSDYACTSCGLSFEPPTPQLFSFNSPQGMCPNCSGLGEVFTFDPELLAPDATMSFKDGAIELIGKWKEMGRWRRHIYQGVADTIEHKRGWEQGTLLETPWKGLTDEQKAIWLNGTGDEHITYTWRGGNSPQKYGGQWEGLIPQFLQRYRGTESKIHQAALEKYMTVAPCLECHGTRLKPQPRAVRLTTLSATYVGDKALSLPQICGLSVTDAARFFEELELGATGQLIAAELLKEIRGRLGFLVNVGLEYLALDRTAPTLSGGESQRIRLASQIGCGLVGVMYILDEPSIGLHPRDNDKLIHTLQQLRDRGNTVIVVEHDEDTMRASDLIVDFGPGPGVRGGEVVAHGSLEKVCKAARSLTGRFLSGKDAIEVPAARRPVDPEKTLKIFGAQAQQPAERRRRISARLLRLRDRGQRFGQKLAGQRHRRRSAASRSQRRRRQAGAIRSDRRAQKPRQVDFDRPIADRPDAALEPRDLHQSLRRHSRSVRQTSRSESTRLQAGPLQLQRQRRALRIVRRERLEAIGNGLPGRRLGDVPRLRRQAFQSRDAANFVQREVDLRRVGDGRAGSASTLRKRPRRAAQTANVARRRARLFEARSSQPDALGRRGATHQTRARIGQEEHRSDVVSA